jgi:hypothetical protein
MVAEPHAWSIYHMTEVMQTKVKSSLMEVNSLKLLKENTKLFAFSKVQVDPG